MLCSSCIAGKSALTCSRCCSRCRSRRQTTLQAWPSATMSRYGLKVMPCDWLVASGNTCAWVLGSKIAEGMSLAALLSRPQRFMPPRQSLHCRCQTSSERMGCCRTQACLPRTLSSSQPRRWRLGEHPTCFTRHGSAQDLPYFHAPAICCTHGSPEADLRPQVGWKWSGFVFHVHLTCPSVS